MAETNADVLGRLLQEVFSQKDGAKRLLEHLLQAAMAAEVTDHVAAEPHQRTQTRRLASPCGRPCGPPFGSGQAVSVKIETAGNYRKDVALLSRIPGFAIRSPGQWRLR